MLDKRCPFCMSTPVSHWNCDNSLYIYECPECSKKGITIRIENPNPEIAKQLWNERAYDEYIFNNANSIKEIITSESGLNIKSQEHQEIFDTLRMDTKNEGYFIMPNLDVINCVDGHTTELLRYLNIYNEIPSFTDADICLKFGVLRISIMSGCLMVAIPMKFKRKQLDKAIEIICQTKYSSLNNYYFYQLVNNDKDEYISYNNINDLIMRIENVK